MSYPKYYRITGTWPREIYLKFTGEDKNSRYVYSFEICQWNKCGTSHGPEVNSIEEFLECLANQYKEVGYSKAAITEISYDEFLVITVN